MFVKICGTTNLGDAELAVELGADALGFIFAPSKRRIEPAQATAIIRFLPKHLLKVGVFTEPRPEEILRTVREAGLTAVQLHMPYDRDLVTHLHHALGDAVQLWQLVGVEHGGSDPETSERRLAGALRMVFADSCIFAVLLDTVKGGVSGGSGESFSWSDAASVVHAAQAGASPGLDLPRLMLAGGLHAENVREAMAILEPWGVDAVSGVEASPGRKDRNRLAAFIAAARANQ